MDWDSLYALIFFRAGLVYLFILSALAQAQAQAAGVGDLNGWEFGAGILVGRSTVIDNAFTAVPYSGVNGGALLSIIHRKDKITQEWQAGLAGGRLKSEPAGFFADERYLNGGYTFLYRIGASGTNALQYKVGGSAGFLYAERNYGGFVNNSSSFEFAASLGTAAEAGYLFKDVLSGFFIFDRLYFPLVSFVEQPAFGSEEPFIKNSSIKGFSSFVQLQNILTAGKEVGHRQKVSFFYAWDGYRIPDPREVKQVRNRFGVRYGITL